eukprot:TRINITY_DN410_c0_g2_i1.p1 TRINITY_DN410_c0_g2~~TRINITY_DN410_c0_g2_i1.p1  ORF type:complete len:334 (+),score=28.34 TRINITY_DN410_c0_g2_i1:187-1188(+)
MAVNESPSALIASWKDVTRKDGAPLARSSHSVAVLRNKAYIFGGEHKPRVPIDNTLHVFDLETRMWSTEVARGDAPPPRVGMTMVAVDETLYIFGGRNGEAKELADLYAFDTITREWRNLNHIQGGPAGRSYHAAVTDERRSSFFVFGGCAHDGRRNDLFEFDTKAEHWKAYPLPPEGSALVPRGGPGLAVVDAKVYVLFGFSGKEQGDIHAFDLRSDTWEQVHTEGETPSSRSVLGVTSFDNRFILAFGGEVDPSDQGHEGAGAFSDEVFVLDTTSRQWLRPKVRTESGVKPPCARGWFAFAAFGGSILVYGGNSATNDRLDDLHLLTIRTT